MKLIDTNGQKSKSENSKLLGRLGRWKRFIVGVVFVPFLVIAGLESLSHFYQCPPGIGKDITNLSACDSEFYIKDVENQKLVAVLYDKQMQGIAPTENELQKAVFEVDREVIGGNNGIACNGVAFVSSDLPKQAKLFVKRHELEHIFQNLSHRQDKNPEFSANVAAAKEYPAGFVTTTFFSIVKSRNSYPSFTCYVIGLWKIFKIYFLP